MHKLDEEVSELCVGRLILLSGEAPEARTHASNLLHVGHVGMSHLSVILTDLVKSPLPYIITYPLHKSGFSAHRNRQPTSFRFSASRLFFLCHTWHLPVAHPPCFLSTHTRLPTFTTVPRMTLPGTLLLLDPSAHEPTLL